MGMEINTVEKVEILTLQDNYIDISLHDDNDIVQRAFPIKHGTLRHSPRAEHGFSAFITITKNGKSRSILFDFGFSDDGAAYNADLLDVDLSSVEVLVLSHGHIDHFGGLEKLMEAGQMKNLDLVLHPVALYSQRYHKVGSKKWFIESFSRERAERAGVNLIQTKDPYPLLDGDGLFLGEIPRITPFEKVHDFYYLEEGKAMPDIFLDDTGVTFHIRGKGLVVLTGCAHSGIVNTVNYAREITGISEVMTIMGGFHLSQSDFDQVVVPTVEELKAMSPNYVIPTHCTGRLAEVYIEKQMSDTYLMNMSGTKLIFSA